MFKSLSKSIIYKGVASCLLATVCLTQSIPPAYAQNLTIPAPNLSFISNRLYKPLMLNGLRINTQEPLEFDFLIDRGDTKFNEAEFTQKSMKLIKYFLAGLTTKEEDMWVNLNPEEPDRIVPQGFGETEMGRDMLAQDYLLKQITASLLHPEGEHGKRFWKKVYAQTGTKDIPIQTLNKVWIVPEKAEVYEGNDVAYVVEAKFKVLTEEEYTANHNTPNASILHETIIPALENEINNSQQFAPLRQIFNSLILATWYKRKLKNSLLTQVYADQNKTTGVTFEEGEGIEQIYQNYVKAFEQGAFDFIQEEYNPQSQDITNRKYISGGVDASLAMMTTSNIASFDLLQKIHGTNAAMITAKLSPVETTDPAMTEALVLLAGISSAQPSQEDSFLLKAIKYLQMLPQGILIEVRYKNQNQEEVTKIGHFVQSKLHPDVDMWLNAKGISLILHNPKEFVSPLLLTDQENLQESSQYQELLNIRVLGSNELPEWWLNPLKGPIEKKEPPHIGPDSDFTGIKYFEKINAEEVYRVEVGNKGEVGHLIVEYYPRTQQYRITRVEIRQWRAYPKPFITQLFYDSKTQIAELLKGGLFKWTHTFLDERARFIISPENAYTPIVTYGRKLIEEHFSIPFESNNPPSNTNENGRAVFDPLVGLMTREEQAIRLALRGIQYEQYGADNMEFHVTHEKRMDREKAEKRYKPVTPSNYQRALQVLLDRFGEKEVGSAVVHLLKEDTDTFAHDEPYVIPHSHIGLADEGDMNTARQTIKNTHPIPRSPLQEIGEHRAGVRSIFADKTFWQFFEETAPSLFDLFVDTLFEIEERHGSEIGEIGYTRHPIAAMRDHFPDAYKYVNSRRPNFVSTVSSAAAMITAKLNPVEATDQAMATNIPRGRFVRVLLGTPLAKLPIGKELAPDTPAGPTLSNFTLEQLHRIIEVKEAIDFLTGYSSGHPQYRSNLDVLDGFYDRWHEVAAIPDSNSLLEDVITQFLDEQRKRLDERIERNPSNTPYHRLVRLATEPNANKEALMRAQAVYNYHYEFWNNREGEPPSVEELYRKHVDEGIPPEKVIEEQLRKYLEQKRREWHKELKAKGGNIAGLDRVVESSMRRIKAQLRKGGSVGKPLVELEEIIKREWPAIAKSRLSTALEIFAPHGVSKDLHKARVWENSKIKARNPHSLEQALTTLLEDRLKIAAGRLRVKIIKDLEKSGLSRKEAWQIGQRIGHMSPDEVAELDYDAVVATPYEHLQLQKIDITDTSATQYLARMVGLNALSESQILHLHFDSDGSVFQVTWQNIQGNELHIFPSEQYTQFTSELALENRHSGKRVSINIPQGATTDQIFAFLAQTTSWIIVGDVQESEFQVKWPYATHHLTAQKEDPTVDQAMVLRFLLRIFFNQDPPEIPNAPNLYGPRIHFEPAKVKNGLISQFYIDGDQFFPYYKEKIYKTRIDGKRVTIRLYKNSDHRVESFAGSIDITGKAGLGPKLIDYGVTHDNNRQYIAEETVIGSTLKELGQLSQSQMDMVLQFFIEMLRQRLVMLDPEPRNLMVGTTESITTEKVLAADSENVRKISGDLREVANQQLDHFAIEYAARRWDKQDPSAKIYYFLQRVSNANSEEEAEQILAEILKENQAMTSNKAGATVQTHEQANSVEAEKEREVFTEVYRSGDYSIDYASPEAWPLIENDVLRLYYMHFNQFRFEFEDEFANPEHGLFIARFQGQVIGFIVGGPVENYDRFSKWKFGEFVDLLFYDENYGKGNTFHIAHGALYKKHRREKPTLALELYRAILNFAKKHGNDYEFITTTTDDIELAHFYQLMGYNLVSQSYATRTYFLKRDLKRATDPAMANDGKVDIDTALIELATEAFEFYYNAKPSDVEWMEEYFYITIDDFPNAAFKGYMTGELQLDNAVDQVLQNEENRKLYPGPLSRDFDLFSTETEIRIRLIAARLAYQYNAFPLRKAIEAYLYGRITARQLYLRSEKLSVEQQFTAIQKEADRLAQEYKLTAQNIVALNAQWIRTTLFKLNFQHRDNRVYHRYFKIDPESGRILGELKNIRSVSDYQSLKNGEYLAVFVENDHLVYYYSNTPKMPDALPLVMVALAAEFNLEAITDKEYRKKRNQSIRDIDIAERIAEREAELSELRLSIHEQQEKVRLMKREEDFDAYLKEVNYLNELRALLEEEKREIARLEQRLKHPDDPEVQRTHGMSLKKIITDIFKENNFPDHVQVAIDSNLLVPPMRYLVERLTNFLEAAINFSRIHRGLYGESDGPDIHIRALSSKADRVRIEIIIKSDSLIASLRQQAKEKGVWEITSEDYERGKHYKFLTNDQLKESARQWYRPLSPKEIDELPDRYFIYDIYGLTLYDSERLAQANIDLDDLLGDQGIDFTRISQRFYYKDAANTLDHEIRELNGQPAIVFVIETPGHLETNEAMTASREKVMTKDSAMRVRTAVWKSKLAITGLLLTTLGIAGHIASFVKYKKDNPSITLNDYMILRKIEGAIPTDTLYYATILTSVFGVATLIVGIGLIVTRSLSSNNGNNVGQAMITSKQNPGGIDLNPQKWNLDVSGEMDVDLGFTPEQIQDMQDNIIGFTPVIINIQATINLPFILGLVDENDKPIINLVQRDTPKPTQAPQYPNRIYAIVEDK